MAARPLLVEHVRKHLVLKRGYYTRIDTAIPRSVQRLLLEGMPDDTVQISLREHGTWIADIKIKVGGKISIHMEEA